MGGYPWKKNKNDKILKNVSLLVETSSWLEPVTFVKTDTNGWLNVERDCISIILSSKVGPSLEKNPVRPCPWRKILDPPLTPSGFEYKLVSLQYSHCL